MAPSETSREREAREKIMSRDNLQFNKEGKACVVKNVVGMSSQWVIMMTKWW